MIARYSIANAHDMKLSFLDCQQERENLSNVQRETIDIGHFL